MSNPFYLINRKRDNQIEIVELCRLLRLLRKNALI